MRVEFYTFALQILQQHTQTIMAAWHTLLQHHFPANLLTHTTLLELHNNLTKTANELGGNLPFSLPIQIFQLPTSYSVHDNQIRIILHIPIMKQPFTLYRHLPIPTDITNQTAVIIYNPRAEYFIISEDNQFHLELSAEQLHNQCHTLGSTFLCTQLGILQTDPATTCLGSLFTNNYNTANNLCTVKLFHGLMAAEQIDDTNFIIYSKQVSNFIQHCEDGTRTAFQLHGLHKRAIPETCTLTSSLMEIRPTLTDGKVYTIQPTALWNFTSLLQGHYPAELDAIISNLTAGARTIPTELHDIIQQHKLHTTDQDADNLQLQIDQAIAQLATTADSKDTDQLRRDLLQHIKRLHTDDDIIHPDSHRWINSTIATISTIALIALAIIFFRRCCINILNPQQQQQPDQHFHLVPPE